MMHVTLILDRNDRQSLPKQSDAGGPYTAICTCPWRSDPLPSRIEAVTAAAMHRSNMKIQEESP